MLSELQDQVYHLLYALFDQFGWFGVAALMAFENITGASPSDLILGLAGWLLLAAHDAPPILVLAGGLYAAIGSVLGASAAYWVVRLGGRPLVDRTLLFFRVKPSVIDRVEGQFRSWGPGLVLFGRLIPGVRILITIPAGLARMPFLRFMLYTFLGTYVWSTVLIGVGYTVGHEWPRLIKAMQPFIPYIIVSALLIALLVLLVTLIILPRLRPRLAPAATNNDERL